jgi:hypothetical protein
MALKSLHQFFYYHNKYLNSMKCQEISMGPSMHIIQCSLWTLWSPESGGTMHDVQCRIAPHHLCNFLIMNRPAKKHGVVPQITHLQA